MLRYRSRTLLRAGASAGALLVSTLVGFGIAQNAVITKDVIFLPTPPEVVEEMLVLASLERGERLIDLGSGDGRIVIGAAKRGASAIGIEIDPELIETSRANAREAGVGKRAEFRNANIFETDLREADVITMYLLPSLNMRLRPTLLDLRQRFQEVGGTATVDDQQLPIEDATLRGPDLGFTPTIDGRRHALRGRMNGDHLEFEPPWRATRAAVALRR